MTRRPWWLMLVVLVALGCAGAPGLQGNGAETGAGGSLDGVLKRTFTTYGFRLESGRVLPEPYVEIDSDFGHLASGADWAKWAPALREFLARLDR